MRTFTNQSKALLTVMPATRIAPGETKGLTDAQLKKKDVQKLIARGVLRATDAYDRLAQASTIQEVASLAREHQLDRDFVSTAFEKAQAMKEQG